ncbi:MAG: hypothetical protein MZV49_19150 [Rhodopseudomonas palustris]|nr:hypothetical protein [Rhodopseudomonas palustris]
MQPRNPTKKEQRCTFALALLQHLKAIAAESLRYCADRLYFMVGLIKIGAQERSGQYPEVGA